MKDKVKLIFMGALAGIFVGGLVALAAVAIWYCEKGIMCIG